MLAVLFRRERFNLAFCETVGITMVISGGLEPSLERAATSSAAPANSQTVAEKATTATKPPPPPATKPGTAVSEMPPPLAPAVPAAVLTPAESAPVPAPSAPAAAAVPLAPPVVAPATVSVAAGVDPPVPVPAAPVAPPAAVPAVSAPSAALSPQAASATTAGPAPLVAPLAPAGTPVAPAGQLSRPSLPDRRLSRPHSPALHQERASSRRRRESPRRNHQQAQWPAHPGGHRGWRGPRGRGGGGAYRPPVTMADLQREVSRAVPEERAAQNQSSSLRAAPAHVAPRQAIPPVDLPPAAARPSPVLAPSAPAPTASAADPGSRLRLPPVPPVAGVEFVPTVGGAAGAQYPPYLAADEPLPFLAVALQPPQTRVPEATLGQLHHLAESLHALLLIQVLAHSSLPAIPADSFHDRPHETCLDAADQLAQLLAPALAAPAEGGAAAVGQLDEAVRGLRRHLRAGSGAATIGASTLLVRELWRTLTGILHALGAQWM
ncbi:unnamed protein product [Closterium sp. Naga37s-1]|nr:unnamed protein product [Closterium sp. Naga37s-1]